jgi:hypothetical protein
MIAITTSSSMRVNARLLRERTVKFLSARKAGGKPGVAGIDCWRHKNRSPVPSISVKLQSRYKKTSEFL